MAESDQDQTDLHAITSLTAEIVGSYVGHHTVAATDLPDLIGMVGSRNRAGRDRADAWYGGQLAAHLVRPVPSEKITLDGAHAIGNVT